MLKYEFKLRRVEEDETVNTGKTDGASLSKREAQDDGDGKKAEEVENDAEVQEK